jgi:peroxiredoxin (alkyl hydroperoxide reductase subunit C)
MLVGKRAPNFTATAVMADGTINSNFNLAEYGEGKYTVLFFYPLDFTFVCPSEILAFDKKAKEFEAAGAVVVGVSVDSQFSHAAYRKTPINEGGIGEVSFPLVADLTKKITTDYGVLCNDSVAFRGTFVIDPKGIVRHQYVNDLPLGRNVDEYLRLVEALKFHEECGEVCPANWNKGEEGMVATAEGVAEYLAKHVANS